MRALRREFGRFLKLLSDNGCLEHVILVGSWAHLSMNRPCLPWASPAVSSYMN